MTSALRLTLALLVSAVLACQEPSGGDLANCEDRPVRMGIASSLREIAERVREDLALRERPIEVERVFGSSSALARQIRLGAPLDLLVSADAEIVDALLEEGFLVRGTEVELAGGRLSLLARADESRRAKANESIETAEPDAARRALGATDLERIAIPAPVVPLGRYARAWLEDQGLLEELGDRIVVTEHARATLSAVDAGLVDMAIVYATDARIAKRAILVAQIDPAEHPPIRYVAARVSRAPDCASVDEVLRAWSTPRTLEQFTTLGFVPPGNPRASTGDASSTAP